MSNSPTEILSTERIASLEQDITEEAQAGRKDGAWQKLQPLRQAQHHQYEATNSLLRIIGQRCLSIDGAADVLLEITQSHPQDTKILATVGECLEAAHEADETIDAYEWNLGICATGSGNGPVALDVWKQMGQEIEMGRFGLPEGSYPHAKVKVAQRPLAERSADLDDPGLEETIWIERLSPCHGIIRSVLYGELGVDYGDVILIDGAPITHHTYGDKQVPVFPHLATLVRRKYKRYDFAGTQHEPRQLADADIELDGDSVIYPHSEYLRQFCARCWRDPDVDHEQHDKVERRIVVGRIAAAPDVDPVQLLDQIDKALARRSGCQLYVPDLCLAAGFQARASLEKRRFDLLTRNE
jgi:hypothetical protein